jgi:hypothetical protein
MCNERAIIKHEWRNTFQYSGVSFFDSDCRQPADWDSSNPEAYVDYSPAIRLTDVLIDATYLINVPIMKHRFCTGASLPFKNHLGTIDYPSALNIHIKSPQSPYCSADYSPFVGPYRNPHIVGKTILTVGNALVAGTSFNLPPTPWATSGNKVPNSLFFATDPVAVECVMCDFPAAEIRDPVDDYLLLGRDAGLGVYERGNLWGSLHNQKTT